MGLAPPPRLLGPLATEGLGRKARTWMWMAGRHRATESWLVTLLSGSDRSVHGRRELGSRVDTYNQEAASSRSRAAKGGTGRGLPSESLVCPCKFGVRQCDPEASASSSPSILPPPSPFQGPPPQEQQGEGRERAHMWFGSFVLAAVLLAAHGRRLKPRVYQGWDVSRTEHLHLPPTVPM